MNGQAFSLRVHSVIRGFLCARAFDDVGGVRADRGGRLGAGSRAPEQSGYALLLVLFMMTLMLITSTAIFMNRRTEGMRDREDQMIWRGNQFVRAIRVYYRKTGHYPQDLDALQKGVADLHFIRPEALKDPMNTDQDGKWRFIYTNAAGQIIGSVKYATMQQMAILDLYGAQVAAVEKSDSDSDDRDQIGSGSTGNCPPGTSAGGSNQPAIAQSMTSTPGQVLPPAPAPNAPSNSFQLGGSSATQNQSGCMTQLPGMPSMAPAALKALAQMKPTGPVDSPVVGGFLVGVGSTVDRTSVKVYKGGKKYDQWEFIYNPVEEQALAIQQGLGQAGTAGGVMGAPVSTPPAQPPPE